MFGKKPGEVGVPCKTLGDNHFDGRIWALMTTPINYIASIPFDPFGKGLFYGYEDKECSNTVGTHCFVFAAGPDSDHGNWGIPYQSSNGVASIGDIWRSRKLRSGAYEWIGKGDYWE